MPTWRCSEPDSLKYVLEHLGELVVKEVHGSGGYGMLVGPAATKAEREKFAEKLKARPEKTTSRNLRLPFRQFRSSPKRALLQGT